MSWETDDKIQRLENRITDLENKGHEFSDRDLNFFDKIVVAIGLTFWLLIPVGFISCIVYVLGISFLGIEHNEEFMVPLAIIVFVISLVASLWIAFDNKYEKK